MIKERTAEVLERCNQRFQKRIERVASEYPTNSHFSHIIANSLGVLDSYLEFVRDDVNSWSELEKGYRETVRDLGKYLTMVESDPSIKSRELAPSKSMLDPFGEQPGKVSSYVARLAESAA